MNYQPQKPAYAHQAKALEAWGSSRAFALLMAMRTGKTKVTIDKWGTLVDTGECEDLLVVAPAGVYRTWEKAVQEHADLGLLSQVKIFTWSAKNQKTKKAQHDFKWFLHSPLNNSSNQPRPRPRILLMNVEALSRVKAAQQAVKAFITQRHCMVAVDESTTIKNAESKRGEFVIREIAPHANYRVILCGLPTPRSPLDLYGQFYFLDKNILGFDNYTAFEKRYADIYQVCMLPIKVLIARMTAIAGPKFMLPGIGMVRPGDLDRQHLIIELQARGMYIPMVPRLKGYRHEDELHAKIKPHSYRVLLGDCYDLPPKIYMRREVELTEEQERIYNELKLFATSELTELGAHVTATHVITRILRLHQVLCGHTKDEQNKVHLIRENRTQEVLNILEEYDGKAIVWCSYDQDVRKVSRAISDVYGGESVARFWGGNKETREEEERNFLTNPRCRFQVATPSAGGRGRTWANADLLIYYSNTNNLEHRAQSEERADEISKTTSICCIDLVAPGTVDEKIIQALKDKMDMAAKITGDNWREWLV